MKKYRFIILLIAIAAAIFASSYIPEPVPAEDFSFEHGGYTTSCAIILTLFLVSMTFSFINGRLNLSPLAKVLLFMGLGVLAFFGLAWLIIKLCGGIISTLWGIGAPVIVIAVSLWLYFHFRKRAGDKVSSNSVRRSATGSGEIKFDFKVLYSSLALLLCIGVIALLCDEPTHYLLLPMAFATLAIVLWKVFRWRGWMLVGILAVVLYVLKYCIPEYISFATDKFWPSMALTLLYLGITVPLADLYCRKEKTI